jgi:TRAP-type C4-dicarboxylate transport system permease small subunit
MTRDSRFDALLDLVVGYMGAFAIASIMVLTTADVVMRYFFNAPVKGAFEITEIMLVTLIFAGMPLASRKNMHVTTDFIDRILPARGLRLLAVTIHLLCAATFSAAAWLLWVKAGKTAAVGLTTTELRIQVAPFVYLVCAPLAVTAMVHLAKAWRAEVSSQDASAGA